jgi:hypothetical protein
MAQKYGNAADDRHQLPEDEGEQRAASHPIVGTLAQ